MTYPKTCPHHHWTVIASFHQWAIGLRTMIERNSRSWTFFLHMSRCQLNISISSSIFGKHLWLGLMLLLLSQILMTCAKLLTQHPMVTLDGRALLYAIIFTKILLATKLLLHGKQQSTMAGFVTHASLFATSLPTVPLMESSTTHLTRNMTTKVSIASMMFFLVIGAGDKQ